LWYERLSPGHPFPRAPTATLRGLPSGSFLDNDNIAEPTHEHIRLLVGKFSLTLHFFFCNIGLPKQETEHFSEIFRYTTTGEEESVLSIRNFLLFFLLITVSLFTLACRKHDQPVAPQVSVQDQSMILPASLRVSLETATAPVNITSLAEVESQAESIPNVFQQEGNAALKFSRLLSIAPNPESGNLALQAYPFASSYWPWIPPGGTYLMTPDHANNGNPSDAWHSRFYDYNIWYRLDWPQSINISRIYLTHYPWYWLGQTVSSIKYLDYSSGVWKTIPVAFPIYSGASRPPVVDISFPSVEANSLLVYMRPGPETPHPNWAVFISEIEVYGTASLKIIHPLDSSVYNVGQTIIFQGKKIGQITNIQWASDLDGPIGTAFPSVATSGLRVGTHTITLSGTAAGTTVSHSIKVGIKGGKPRVTKIDFRSMSGHNNLNRIYDRKGAHRQNSFLEPVQWKGIEVAGDVQEEYCWPLSYVRSNGNAVGNGQSRLRLEATFKDMDNSPSLYFHAQLVGKLYENGVYKQDLNFDEITVATTGSAEKIAFLESTNGLPDVVGIWSLELEWSFSQSGLNIGSQRNPRPGTFQTIFTTWEKPLANGYFFQDEESKPGGPMKVEEIPTYYLEFANLSCEFAKNANSSNTKTDVLVRLLGNAWNLGSQGFKYDGQTAAIPNVTPRGLDSLLDLKTGWCEEWSTFFKALAESQGVDIWYRGIKLTPEQVHILKQRLYLTNRNLPALGGDDQNPEPKWWSFRDHAYNSTDLQNVFDLSFFCMSPSEETYTNNGFDLVNYPFREVVNPDPFPSDIHIFLAYD